MKLLTADRKISRLLKMTKDESFGFTPTCDDASPFPEGMVPIDSKRVSVTLKKNAARAGRRCKERRHSEDYSQETLGRAGGADVHDVGDGEAIVVGADIYRRG